MRFVLAFLALAFPALAQDNALTIATYNVENLFDNADDPFHADEGTSPKSRAEMRILAKTIDTLGADVLAMQEVENLGVLRLLNTMLSKPYAFIGFLSTNDRRGIHTAVMSRVRIKRSMGHRHWPLEGKQKRFARGLPVFELEPSEGRTLLVAPVHFKSKRTLGKDKQGVRWRTAEANGVLEVLDDLRARGFCAPFVLLGDLNDERDSASLASLFDRLKDATAVAPEENRYSYIWSGRKQQIDFVLYDGELAVKSARFVHDPDAASDHAPAMCTVSWPAPVRRVAAEIAGGAATSAELRRPQVDATDVHGMRSFLLQEVEAKGKVHSVERTKSGGHVLIKFGKDPRQSLTVFIPRGAVARFAGIDAWKGKGLTVVGPVFAYRGRLEIKLTRKEQLR